MARSTALIVRRIAAAAPQSMLASSTSPPGSNLDVEFDLRIALQVRRLDDVALDLVAGSAVCTRRKAAIAQPRAPWRACRPVPASRPPGA